MRTFSVVGFSLVRCPGHRACIGSGWRHSGRCGGGPDISVGVHCLNSAGDMGATLEYGLAVDSTEYKPVCPVPSFFAACNNTPNGVVASDALGARRGLDQRKGLDEGDLGVVVPILGAIADVHFHNVSDDLLVVVVLGDGDGDLILETKRGNGVADCFGGGSGAGIAAWLRGDLWLGEGA